MWRLDTLSKSSEKEACQSGKGWQRVAISHDFSSTF